MRYANYSTEDFIQDESFQQWVYAPDEELGRYWKDFQAHYPHQRESIDEAKEFLLLMKSNQSVPDSAIARIKAGLNDRIDEEELKGKFKNASREARPAAVFPFPRKVYYGIAASVLIAVSFVTYFISYDNDGPSFFKNFAVEQLEAHKGEQRYIDLEDGTKVWLNADSRISYSKNFMTSDSREVFLEGEAFFEVANHAHKPFVVSTSEISIKVLGTAFNVKSYAKDRFVETTLVRGKISLASKEENQAVPVTLAPNQQAVFIKDSKKIVLEENINSDDYTGWKNGWIVFDDKPFSYIRETLERWYNVSITMEDENSLACTFSAKFNDKTLVEVLEIFKNTESINYAITGDEVFITGKLCE